MRKFRKTSVKRRPRRKGAIVKTVTKILRHKGLNSPEVKFFDTLLGSTAVTQAGIFQSICLMQQGLSFFDRIGAKISVVGINAKVIWTTPLTANTAPDVVSMGLLCDKQPNGANPPALNSTINVDNTETPFVSTVAAQPYTSLMFHNLIQKGRYRYLWEKYTNQHSIPSLIPDTYANGNYKPTSVVQGVYHYNKRFKAPIVIEYDDNNGNITDLSKNNIVFYAGARNAGTSSVLGLFRIAYTDS